MTSNPITSDAHINAVREAIAFLVDEYETLDGRAAVPAPGRRALAMDRVSAVTFRAVTDYLDAYDLDSGSNGLLVEGTLEWSLFVTDLMVTAMLDFREKPALRGHRSDDCRTRLQDMLLRVWVIAMDELDKDPHDETTTGDSGDTSNWHDAGAWGDIAA